MAADFGVRQAVKGPPWLLIFGGLAVLLIVGTVYASHTSHTARHVAEYEAYQLGGKPCAEVSQAAFAANDIKAHQGFDYDGLVFTRAYGHAECTELATNGGRGWGSYPACRFTGPAVVGVSTPKAGSHYYVTGVGHGVVISFPHGRPVCEVGEGIGKISQ